MKPNKFKYAILSCWIVLIVCMIVKLLGFNIFEPKTDNQTFIRFCEYLDTHNYLKYIVYCAISLVLNSLSILAILGQKFYTKIQFALFVPLIIAMSLVGWYSQIANLILGVILYSLPIIWLKKRWYRVLIGVGFILLFQAISIVTKNIGYWYLNNEYSLVTIILQLDSVLMTFMYYLYSNHYTRKEIS